MRWTVQQISAAALLLLIVISAIAWLPRAEAWALLGQVAGGAAKVLFGG